MTKTDIRSFFGNRIIVSKDGCWNWLRSTNGRGYGRMRFGGVACSAHRVSFQLRAGKPIPKDRKICHRCDNPRCVNPSHLFSGSQKDNMRDMFRKRRKSHSGQRNPNSRLTEDQARDIKTRYLFDGGHALAREYGVSRNLPGMIFRGQIWKDL